MEDAGYRPRVSGTAAVGDTDVMDVEPSNEKDDAGYRFLGVGIGLGNALLYTVLPVLLFISIWTLVSVYAIVKWAGSAPDQPNPVVLVVGVASLVMLFVVLIAVGIGLMGRAMNPKKRAR
jgi:hypothetical protein